MQAIVNPAYPNRIQLMLESVTGPLTSTVLGAFDPRRDLEVYIGGSAANLVSFSFDAANNRYLAFTSQIFDTTALVQVIHHLPAPPFTAGATPVPGLALIASIATVFDVVVPTVGLSVPAGIVQNQPVAFTWSALSVPQIRITTTTGYDSGLLAAPSSAGVVYTAGFSSSGNYTATIAGYDSSGVAIPSGSGVLTSTIPLVIAAS